MTVLPHGYGMSLIVEIKDDASLTSNSVYGLVYIIGLTPTRVQEL